LTDVEGYVSDSFGIYRSLVFDVEPDQEQAIFHFCEGNWYKVERAYVERLRNYLDSRCLESDLCAYNHDETKDGKAVYSEGKYNASISAWNNRFICLDQTDISPTGHTQVEPCDVYSVEQDASTSSRYRAVFYHLKISTRSAHLSHLFNQGVNSITLIELEASSRQKMKALVTDRLNGNDPQAYLAPLESFDFKVVFCVITHKEVSKKSGNLPLFSKISLMRSMQQLDLMKVPSSLMFVEDKSPKKEGHAKHTQIIVEVFERRYGGIEVRPVAGQGFDPRVAIKGCPREVRDSGDGARYSLSVKVTENGELRSFHNWPYERVA
jgi:uncharacterized protein (TIGR04141 family)